MVSKYTKKSSSHNPFQSISRDILGPLHCLPYPGAHKPIKMFALATGCLNYGAFNVQLIEDCSTKSVLLGLIKLKTRFSKNQAIPYIRRVSP